MKKLLLLLSIVILGSCEGNPRKCNIIIQKLPSNNDICKYTTVDCARGRYYDFMDDCNKYNIGDTIK